MPPSESRARGGSVRHLHQPLRALYSPVPPVRHMAQLARPLAPSGWVRRAHYLAHLAHLAQGSDQVASGAVSAQRSRSLRLLVFVVCARSARDSASRSISNTSAGLRRFGKVGSSPDNLTACYRLRVSRAATYSARPLELVDQLQQRLGVGASAMPCTIGPSILNLRSRPRATAAAMADACARGCVLVLQLKRARLVSSGTAASVRCCARRSSPNRLRCRSRAGPTVSLSTCASSSTAPVALARTSAPGPHETAHHRAG